MSSPTNEADDGLLPHPQRASLSSISVNSGHCSGQTGSGGSTMEIHEMTSYNCISPEKYWNHQHGACGMVQGTTSGRHSTVYPPVFYTPPPPQAFSSCNVSSAQAPVSGTAPEWNCSAPPPPPPHADTYSHFLYSQYPPHNDYNNFLGIPTSCYDTDILMVGGVSISGQASGILAQQPAENNACEQSQPQPSALLYPPPQSTFDARTPSTYEKYDKASGSADPTSTPSSPSSSSAEESSTSSEETEDEDSDNVCVQEKEDYQLCGLSRCTLCRKPSNSIVSPQHVSQSAPSPQLSRILGEIDDDELDISVCSGDIEIGGIEDEMMQQETDASHNSFKITLDNLAKLMKIPVYKLLSEETRNNLPIPKEIYSQYAILCFKCQKFVDLAESLEKQLTSVISSLRQNIEVEVDNLQQQSVDVIVQERFSTSSTQTETDYGETSVPNQDKTDSYRYVLVLRENPNLNLNPAQTNLDKTQQETSTLNPTNNQFLCHECGRTFSCGRNLGKHLKRSHYKDASSNMIPCTRESCTQKCSTNSRLKDHLLTHVDDKQHFCGNCLKLFSTKSNLNVHLREGSCMKSDIKSSDTLSNDLIKRSSFRCENCGLTFRTEQRFRLHAKVSCSKTNVFQCDICSKLFAKRSELRAHQSVHSGTKPFPCDICGLGFSTKGNQMVHQRTHSIEKRFKCPQCGKGFTRNLTLQSHLNKICTQKGI